MIGMLIGAWMDVRSQPFRTTAAIAGLVAAVLAVILVDSAAVLSNDANSIYLARKYGMPVTLTVVPNSTRHDNDLTPDIVLRGNGFEYISIDANIGNAVIAHNGQTISNGFRWVNSTYPDIRIVDLTAGDWPIITAQSQTLHAVVVSGWGQQMFGLSDAEMVGLNLEYALARDGGFNITTTPLMPIIIDGVVRADTAAFFGSGPITVVSDLVDPVFASYVSAPAWLVRTNPGDASLATSSLQLLSKGGAPAYSVQRADQSDELAPVLRQQKVTGSATKIVALAVGGLGILGVGVSGVRERASEFGLRRAIGAKRRRIFGSVLTQTVMEALIAAVIAIPISALLLECFARDLVLSTLPMPPSTLLPVQSAIQGLVGALIVGILAGLIPAVSAAKASVVRALRG